MENSATSQVKSPLSEFWRFATDFRHLSSWIVKAVIAAPLADLLLKIGPPYSRIFISGLMSIFLGLVVMVSFEFWRTATRRIGRRVFIGGIAAATILFITYLCVSAFFIVDADDQGNQEIIGYTLHNEVGQMAASNPGKWTPKELLLQFHDPMQVWTRESVITMRIILVLLWIAMWIGVGVAMAAFVALQWGTSSSRTTA